MLWPQPGAAPQACRTVAFSRQAKHLLFSRNDVKCILQKYFSLRKAETHLFQSASRPHEGRSRTSRYVVRAAMDAKACRRSMLKRTVKPCGPDPPMLGSSRSKSIGDGG